ncbi:uncharacterized protein LOC127739384 [Mytilus californianus]|uniref:uncharacterized protein LOC127739384 n=1 Tax=Mytilus californianus TaxID=6549 RepID=UPI002246DA26|nr:uncharacterized protein LOC127739384 [Mytilus californianus]
MSSRTCESLKSYDYACQKFGTFETVRLRRNLYNLQDMIRNDDPSLCHISSGSAVEGLDMIGSDLDMMAVINGTVVCLSERDAENVAEETNIRTLIMDIDSTNPCYALLRVPKKVTFPENIHCFLEHRGQHIFYSSQLFKLSQLDAMSHSGDRYKIHGPCVTTEDETIDQLFCFRCKSWPSQARPWMSRSRINHWPSPQLISKIVNFGVLFVPIGCKGSINEDIEWRMSFSVAEKFLIYSFNHTQLLCYGLMKLVLKDVADKNESLKGILCSYFLKTLLFWLCEESDKDMWKPENILSCFRACICRLLYCVQYSILVHYFIPQNNFFECRFKKDEHIQMIGLLKEVRHHGWQCFRVSGTFSGDFHTLYNPNYDSKVIHPMIWCMVESMADYLENDKNSLVIVKKILQFSRIKLAVNLIMFLWEKSKNLKVQRDTITKYYINNKLQYTHFKQQLRLLIISKHKQCPDTGWMFLASFFYRHKRYHIVLEIISYVLSRSLKVDPSTLETTVNIVHFEKMSAMLILHMLVSNIMIFENGSALIPDELDIEVRNNSSLYLAVIIFTHFLKFLSYYHLGDFTSCMESLRGLEKCTYNLYRYKALGKTQIISSFLCLGIAHEMIGHVNEAHECFSTCVSFGELNTTKAALRLSKL